MKRPLESQPIDQQINSIRADYEDEVRGLSDLVASMRIEGASSEAIARAVSSARLELSRRYKAATPEPLRSRIIARTVAEYGNPNGPDVEYLRSRGRTWEEIIAGALRPGPPINLEGS